MDNNKIIGPNSIINFDFNQKEINSKIDTGAETNSLHSNNFFIKNGNLHCELLDHTELIIFKNYKIKHVKSSNGLKNKRYCVKLKFKIDGQAYESEFTLNDRSNMEYPVLIGKNFLNDNNFLVDVSKPYTELKEEKYLVRTFNENIDSEELVWHRDMEDRIVKSLGDTDWMIQMDNELPRPLTEMVYIPKNTYHRVIKGTGDLKVRVNKLTEISNPSKEMRNIIDIRENKINEAVNATFVKDFLVDFATLMSLNFSQITKMGKDEKATNELKAMMERIRKPIINGQTYFEIIKDNINTIPNNPKLLSAILSQVKNFIEYIEPRVESFVKDGPATNGVNYKESWLGRIKKIKEDYIKIVS